MIFIVPELDPGAIRSVHPAMIYTSTTSIDSNGGLQSIRVSWFHPWLSPLCLVDKASWFVVETGVAGRVLVF